MSKNWFRKKCKATVEVLRKKWSSTGLFLRFNSYPVFLSAILGGLIVYWWLIVSPNATLQSAQWTLSAEVEGLATFLGIILVGLTLLWSQAMGEESRLRGLVPIYYELLRTGGHQKQTETPFIETLRRDYLEKIKAHTLPRKVFPYEHRKYRTHRDLFLDICRLTQVVSEHYGLPSNTEGIEKDLGDLGYSEKEVTLKLWVPWYDLKSGPEEFLELVTDVFNPANTTLDSLKGGGEFGMKVWDETLRQNTETSLERLKRFHSFRKHWLRAGLGVYVLTIATGLIALSVANATQWRHWLMAALFFGFLDLEFAVIFFHQLVRAK